MYIICTWQKYIYEKVHLVSKNIFKRFWIQSKQLGDMHGWDNTATAFLQSCHKIKVELWYSELYAYIVFPNSSIQLINMLIEGPLKSFISSWSTHFRLRIMSKVCIFHDIKPYWCVNHKKCHLFTCFHLVLGPFCEVSFVKLHILHITYFWILYIHIEYSKRRMQSKVIVTITLL